LLRLVILPPQIHRIKAGGNQQGNQGGLVVH
jgi:hypothetical protein